MPMSDPVDSTGPLMKGDDERTPGKLVTLRDVGHTFTGDTWLFRSLNADLRPDRVYALVGPSGSGKSTLLSILWVCVAMTTFTCAWKFVICHYLC